MYNYSEFISSTASAGTGWPFVLQVRGKSEFLVLLCNHCEAFTGVL